MRTWLVLALLVRRDRAGAAAGAEYPVADRRAKLADRLRRHRPPVCRLRQDRARARRRVGHRHRRRAGPFRSGGRARCRIEHAGRRRHGLPDRVDDQELHRDGDPEASRRGEAVARRSRRALRDGAQESPVSHQRRSANHRPAPADPRARAFPRTTPGAISSSPKPRRASRGCCATGFRSRPRLARPTRYSNYGFAILGRIVANVSRQPYDEYVTRHILQPLGMSSTTLHADRVAKGRLAHRVSLGGRAMEGRAGAAARILRLDGRHADDDPRFEPLCVGVARRVATARRTLKPGRFAARRCARCSSRGVRRRFGPASTRPADRRR